MRVDVILALVRSMRPKQWSKNLLVFAGLLFTIGQKQSPDATVRVLLAFGIFCLVSGAVYILNDILDADKDRRHPRKRTRPIAAGDVSKSVAAIFAVALVAISITGAFRLAGGLASAADLRHPSFAVVVIAYLVLTTAYSLKLKHVVIVDLMAIAAGFVMRAVAGAVVIAVPISPWFLLCTTLLALFVGLAKRRNELITLEDGAGSHRKILDDYSADLLDQMMNITAASALMAYSFYTFSAPNHNGVQHRYMMTTIPFVIYGIFRYLYLCHKKNAGGHPEQIFLGDRPMLINTLLWAGVVALVLKEFS